MRVKKPTERSTELSMPCYKCSNGKYRIGEGQCSYSSKKKCEEALKAYKAKKSKGRK